jgi:hypothetical protein
MLYVFRPNIINPMYIQQLREMIPPPSHNPATVCNQITLLIFYYISPKQKTLLNATDARVYVSDIF